MTVGGGASAEPSVGEIQADAKRHSDFSLRRGSLHVGLAAAEAREPATALPLDPRRPERFMDERRRLLQASQRLGPCNQVVTPKEGIVG